jgi:hypothetical protein
MGDPPGAGPCGLSLTSEEWRAAEKFVEITDGRNDVLGLVGRYLEHWRERGGLDWNEFHQLIGRLAPGTQLSSEHLREILSAVRAARIAVPHQGSPYDRRNAR